MPVIFGWERSILFFRGFFVPKPSMSDLLHSLLFMIRLIARAFYVLSSKRWGWMKRPISPVWCRRVSLMPRTIWFLLPVMQRIRKPLQKIRQPRFLHFAISIVVIGNVAARQELWISMICLCIPIYYSVIFRRYWHVIVSNFAMCW